MATTAAAVASVTDKGGFWIRTLASIIDAIVLGIVGSILGGFVNPDPASPTRIAFDLLIVLLYFLYFWSAQGGGQTPGMRPFNLKVVRTDGSSLTIAQALIRDISLAISILCIFIGVIWVAFDANKQGWHDRIAGTYVVRTP